MADPRWRTVPDQLWDRDDLDTTFASLKSVYLNPKLNVRVIYIQRSAEILPSVLFDPRSFTENLFLSKLLLIPLNYFIIFVKNIQRNMNKWGEKGVGAGQKKSPSFTKRTREINQRHGRANNCYIYIYMKNRWKRLHIFGKSSFLDLEPLTMIRVTSHLYWCLNLEVFVDVWLSQDKSIVEFSIVYKKNECFDMA